MLDSGKPADIICLDFSKAFDRVPHEILFYKLKTLQLPPPIFNTIVNYVKGRTQYVTIGNKQSDLINVSSKVPQESVLGPALFSLFINDLLSRSVNTNIIGFADDVKLYGIPGPQLQADIDAVDNWAKQPNDS